MLRQIRTIIILFFIIIPTAFADPWFGGLLLTDRAQVWSLGHGVFSLDESSDRNFGVYNNNYAIVTTPRYSSDEFSSSFIYGLASDVDAQLSMHYLKNQNEGQSFSGLGDTLVELGFQLMRQGESKKRSDVRFILKELFPTGRYDGLDPTLYTTDALGTGSYLSTVGMSVRHLMQVADSHYFTLHASVLLTAASTVHLIGLSAYGGSRETRGFMRPGNSISVNIATEYSLAENLSAGLEAYFYSKEVSNFTGTIANDLPAFLSQRNKYQHPAFRHAIFNKIMPSLNNIGSLFGIGSGNVVQTSLSPSLSYRINDTFTVSGGTDFTLKGKNSPAHITSILNFSMMW